MRQTQTKKIIVVKMQFDLVDWRDDTYIPNYEEIASTLKIISIFKGEPSCFNKAQSKIISKWLKENSVEKFVKAKVLAEKHQAMLAEDCELADAIMWTKRINMNH